MLKTLGETTTEDAAAATPLQERISSTLKDLATRYPIQTVVAALVAGALIGGPLLSRR